MKNNIEQWMGEEATASYKDLVVDGAYQVNNMSRWSTYQVWKP